MEIKLLSLDIVNFKGLKTLHINFDGQNKVIAGDNGTGKTTVFDAFGWLLWGKDSLNQTNFGIKPYLPDGEQAHNLESRVTGILQVDDQTLTLAKVYKAVWTKKRGQTQAEFTGHTTDHYINGVPVKAKEYTDKIGLLLTEEQFKLLSNPMYFNAVLDRKARRDLLLSLAKTITPEHIVQANPALKELDLEHYSIDDIRSMAKAAAKRINRDLESLPVRIDELAKQIKDLDFAGLEEQATGIKKRIDELDQQLADSSKVSEAMQKITSTIQTLYQEQLALKREQQVKLADAKQARQQAKIAHDSAVAEQQARIERLQKKIESKKSSIADGQKKQDELTFKIEQLRQKWTLERSKAYDGGFDCPTCGRELPQAQQDDILAKFNVNKAQILGDITAQAEELKKRQEEITQEVSTAEADLQTLQQELEQQVSIILPAPEAQSMPEFPLPPRAEEIDREIAKLEGELRSAGSSDNSHLLVYKKAEQAKLETVSTQLAYKASNVEIRERILAYEAQEKELAKAYEEQQRILALCDLYTSQYAAAVSAEINLNFTYVNFKLFDQQINGGLAETAEATINGVPYSDANTAAKINAGLDIIAAFGRHLGLKVPVFVDNAESVNRLLDPQAQLIELKVTQDKALKVI